MRKMRERIARQRVSYLYCTAKRFLMDPQDQKLLDKQLRYLRVPSRRDGVVIAAIVAVFIGGIIIGGIIIGGALAEPREPATVDRGRGR